MINNPNKNNQNQTAVCVVGNYLFLRKYLNKFVNQVRENGKFRGEIIVLTSSFTITSLLRIKDRNNVTFIKQKKIKFDKNTEDSLRNLDTNNQPNRHIKKNFQWHKLHLFDICLKKWDFIFYIDINMEINHDINPILKERPLACLYANPDDITGENGWTLETQFDKNHTDFQGLQNMYNLQVKDYFQSGIMYFDTDIVSIQTKEDLLKLVRRYPFTLTNEQAILNLYFYFQKNIYQMLPPISEGIKNYSYWKADEEVRISKANLSKSRK